MKNAYPSPKDLPKPTSELRDDLLAERLYLPNGEDCHYYNLRYGNRWQRADIPDLAEQWGENS